MGGLFAAVGAWGGGGAAAVGGRRLRVARWVRLAGVSTVRGVELGLRLGPLLRALPFTITRRIGGAAFPITTPTTLTTFGPGVGQYQTVARLRKF